MRLSDLNRSLIAPEEARVLKPSFQLIQSPRLLRGTESPPATFEVEVFNFVFANRERLGVSSITRCRNVRVDGLIDLADGQRLALEVKYRMNWEKACQACSQFSWFVKRADAVERPVDGAIVVFRDFSADWARRSPSRLLENGWNYWYTDHHEVEGRPCNLVRLRDGTLESFPLALEAARGRL